MNILVNNKWIGIIQICVDAQILYMAALGGKNAAENQIRVYTIRIIWLPKYNKNNGNLYEN